MGNLISKELLSEVLAVDIRKINNSILDGNLYYYKTFVKCKSKINIYELADKIIDWIESKGYWIKKEYKDIYQLIYKGIEVYGIDTKTRTDVPFMCGKWILENKATK